MGVIKEYNSPNAAAGLRVSDKGISALESEASAALRTSSLATREIEATGRSIKSGLDAVGDTARTAWDQYVVQPEISKGAALLSGIQDDLTQKWNDYAKNSDPNDASIKRKFIEEYLQPEMDRFNESFQTAEGRKFATDQSNSFIKHMYDKTTADMASRAGTAILANAQAMHKSLANMVYRDPSSYDHAVSTLTSSVKALAASSPMLTPAAQAQVEAKVAGEMKADLARASILGMATRNPEAAEAIVASGKFDSVLDVKETMDSIRTIKNYNHVDKERARVQADRDAEELSQQTQVEYEKKLWTDPKSVSAVGALQDARLTDKAKIIVARTIEAEASEGLGVSKRVSRDNAASLYRRVASLDAEDRITDPNVIRQAYIDKKIDRTDRDDLLKTFSDMKTPAGESLKVERNEFFKRFQLSIDAGMEGDKPTALGQLKMYEAEMAARRKEAELRAKGEDPHSLYDPTSKNYFGKQENILKYTATLSDNMAYKAKMQATRSLNLTSGGSEITGIEVIDIPEGMSPADVLKKYAPGTRIRIQTPDGPREGTVPAKGRK